MELGDYHGLGAMANAVVEGLAYESRLLLDAIEIERGAAVTKVTAMGGGSRSPSLLSALAKVLDREISIAAEVETAALGAAMLAAAGGGFEGASDLTEVAARRSGTVRSVVPDASQRQRQLYDGLFAVYRTLYPSLRDAFAALAVFH